MKKLFAVIFFAIVLISCDDNSTNTEIGLVDADETVDVDYMIEVDESVEVDDENVEVDDESAEIDDENVEVDDEIVEIDDEAVEVDDESAETDDENAEVDDEAVEVDDNLTDEDNSDDDVFVPEDVVFVKFDATGLNDGTSWENAFTDLSVAIASAIEGKDIWVAAGTYYPTDCPNLYNECDFETPQREYHFTLLQGVGIYGGFTGTETDISQRDWNNNETVLSGDFNGDDELVGNSENAYHVFYHDGWERKDSTAILDGFTISGGNANGAVWPYQDGGGIRNNKREEFGSDHTTPIIRNCFFINNSATLVGGAIYNHEGASPTIENCTFVNNSADKGGAIFNYLGTPMILNSTFSGNSAITGGGAVGIDTSDVTIENSVFSNNSSVNAGGAIYLRESSASVIKTSYFTGNASQNGGAVSSTKNTNLTIESCNFQNNAATGAALPNGLGGAVQNQGATAIVINSVFKGNGAVAGGAIANLMANASIINCSISANIAGGGIVNGQSNPLISNTIIYGNTSYDLYNIPAGTYGMAASIPLIDHSDIGGCGGSSMTCGDGSEACWVAGCGTDNGNNIDDGPLFKDSGDHPLMLMVLSPCVDSGDSTKVPVSIIKDIAGNDRINGTSVDMGAYEFHE